MKWIKDNYQNLWQFIKFGIVGVSNTLIHYFTYLICISLGMHYILASSIGFVISVTNSYIWNNKYVFKQEEGTKRVWWKAYMKTFLSYAATGLILENVLLVVWIDMLGINKTIAPLVTLLITIPLNFLMNKFWAYKDKKVSGEK